MKTIPIIYLVPIGAILLWVVGVTVQNPNPDRIYLISKGNPTPVPTATPSQGMPQAHFHWLNPPGGDEAVMARFEQSDPKMIAALREGELSAFETEAGHPPVRWPDNPGLK